ncbi:MAG: aryl-alcohol dehydrogenase-like predicted oxidoreductase [Gammaproteobacteria bacterium]|jgi:aryl-alcohol dehydrogenase-like predicted oxidoreductase
MEKRQIGRSDLQVSVVGLGGNVFGPPRLDQRGSIRNIHRAQDLGINFIDTAAIYGQGNSESYIGNALKDRQSDWIVATKFTLENLGDETPAERITRQTEESLKALKRDAIDLLQIHFPRPNVPPEVILEVLNKFVIAGKVRYVGACNYSSWRQAAAIHVARASGLPEFVSSQNHYNLLNRFPELELLRFCAAYEIGFLPYFPLAAGLLTGKYRPGKAPPPGSRGAARSPALNSARTPRNEAIVEQLDAWARARDHSVAELAIAWLLARPVVSSVITGTSSVEQVETNAKAASWRLTDSEIADVDAIARWDGSGEGLEGERMLAGTRSPGAASPRPR